MVTARIKTIDRLKFLKASLQDISKLRVYVGVPEDKADDGKHPINEAQLIYVQTNGSPIHNIPPRPIIEPAIEAPENKAVISNEIKLGMAALLDQKKGQAKAHMRRAGQEGVNAVKNWFDDPRNGWFPLAESTIEARARRKFKVMSRKTFYGREMMRQNLAYYFNTGDFRILIDTGEMRKAIIWVMGDEV